MPSNGLRFLISALVEHNPRMESARFMEWFAGRSEAHRFSIEQIPFSELVSWSFERLTGNLVHDSGKFFSIEGVWVETSAGHVKQWSQPIINQPEIGVLGILAKEFDGVLHFLMQAKMEPGNLNMVQLAPTLQATRSNYTRVHRGKSPLYLEYFAGRRGRVLVDTLHSEQGARFLRKRNRNVIVEVEEAVPVYDDYCWLTLGQLHRLLHLDNVVNMDARTVLSCISYAGPETEGLAGDEVLNALRRLAPASAPLLPTGLDDFTVGLLTSALEVRRARHPDEEVISWFTGLKVDYELDVTRIPLRYVRHWEVSDREIYHRDGKYFTVIAVRVQADNREVSCWTQPIIKPREEGLMAYVVKEIHGVPHFLIQGKVEPGNFDVVEMAPSVQCITGSYRHDDVAIKPAFLDDVLAMPADQVYSSSLQSEEGGRFFREANRNMVIRVGDEFPTELPKNYIWLSLHQLKRFIKFNNYLNVQARCLLPGFAPKGKEE